MNKEIIKTIVLVFLVAISYGLSWNVISYQPEYKNKVKENTFKNIEIQSKTTEKELFQPREIIDHTSGENLLYDDSDLLHECINEFLAITPINFHSVRIIDSGKTFYESVIGQKWLELVFWDKLSLGVYSGFVHYDGSNSNDKFEFNRIFISENRILFFQNSGDSVVEVEADNNSVIAFYTKCKESFKNYSYLKVNLLILGAGHMIYAPFQSKEIAAKEYLIRLHQKEDYVAFLYGSSQVKNKNTKGTTIVSDGTSRLSIFNNLKTFSYVKPSISGYSGFEQKTNIVKVIDFVNSHSGWDLRYRYMGLTLNDEYVRFRLTIDNIPVFNIDGKSEIIVGLGENGVVAYKRPYFYLDADVSNDNLKELLPSAASVLSDLEKVEWFNKELLTDMIIGYKMSFGVNEERIAILKPMWYLKYNFNWKESSYFFGDKYGLE